MYKNKKKTILYIMGIEWNWIFQRPQIFEQYLEKNYIVKVIFPKSIVSIFNFNKKNLPSNYRVLWTIPFQEKNNFIGWFSKIIASNLFFNIHQYDMIIIGYPLYYRYISDYKGKIIFDCMDHYAALYPYQKKVKELTLQEQLLAERCDGLIVSSNKLRVKMLEITDSNKITLIRNGTYFTKSSNIKQIYKKKKYKLCYFGVIAEWFDFNVLDISLQNIKDIEYHLIGPVKSSYVDNERVILEGVIDHQKLPECTKDFDCFVMPFIVNEVVEYVDPVKLYEYISLGKCIIAVYYEEILRFENYVYFYNDEVEYINLINELKEKGFPPKYTEKMQDDFLLENSWYERFKSLDKIINNSI